MMCCGQVTCVWTRIWNLGLKFNLARFIGLLTFRHCQTSHRRRKEGKSINFAEEISESIFSKIFGGSEFLNFFRQKIRESRVINSDRAHLWRHVRVTNRVIISLEEHDMGKLCLYLIACKMKSNTPRIRKSRYNKPQWILILSTKNALGRKSPPVAQSIRTLKMRVICTIIIHIHQNAFIRRLHF